MKNEINDDLLWSYLDGSLAHTQKQELEEQLKIDPKLGQRLEELQELDRYARTNLLESPSLNFTQAVMSGIKAVKIKPKKSDWLLILGVLFATLISTFYLTDASLSFDLNVSLDKFEPISKYLPSQEVDIDKTINLNVVSKGLLYLVLFLSLLVFDRAILRPYFKNRQVG